MICIIALVTFSILGLFSARYRIIAKEAFRCVFLKMQFKPCDTKLDQRIKSKITSTLLNRSPKLAKFVYKRFELLSWIFTIAMFVSLGYTIYSFYNLLVYGSCDPTGVCYITFIAGVCILDIEKYLAIIILSIFAISITYLLIKRNHNKHGEL